MKWPCYLLIPVVLCIDLVTRFWADQLFGGVKTILPGLLTIRVVSNRGVLFGLGEDAQGGVAWWIWPILFLTLAFLFWLAHATDGKKKMRHIGIACMIGGALGNGLDRALHGHVLDFIQIFFFPILNLADLAILGGMVLVLVDLAQNE